MRFKNLSIILIPALSMLLASDAGAVIITSKYQPPEIFPAEKGAFTPYPMIASFLMGVVGYNNSLPIVQDALNPNTQDQLLAQCTDFNSSWPLGCSPLALATAVSSRYAPQHWLVPVYSMSKRNVAIANQISAMRSYKSPVVIPVFGHVDHWGTIYQMDAVNNYTQLDKVWYRDGGTPIGEDPNVIVSDSEGVDYTDEIVIVTGPQYEMTYYKILTGFILEPTDPLVNKYIFAYDPPKGTRLPETAPRITFERGTPLVEPGEMNVELAPLLVWDALDDEGLLQDPRLRGLGEATPGDAWQVRGRTPSGEAWDYIVVPMFDEDMTRVIALAGLDADDGGFERLYYLGTPRVLDLPSRGEAVQRASRLLQAGESLGAGILAWDPACGSEHCRQPLLPYHEFVIKNRHGAAVGQVTVPLGGLAVSRR